MIVVLAENERMVQRTVDECDCLQKRRKQKVTAGKSRVMVSRRAGKQTIDFVKPSKVKVDHVTVYGMAEGRED